MVDRHEQIAAFMPAFDGGNKDVSANVNADGAAFGYVNRWGIIVAWRLPPEFYVGILSCFFLHDVNVPYRDCFCENYTLSGAFSSSDS